MTMLDKISAKIDIKDIRAKTCTINGQEITLQTFIKANKVMMALAENVTVNEQTGNLGHHLQHVLTYYKANYSSIHKKVGNDDTTDINQRELFLHIIDHGYNAYGSAPIPYEILLQLQFDINGNLQVNFYDPANSTRHPLASTNKAGEISTMEGEIKKQIEAVFKQKGTTISSQKFAVNEFDVIDYQEYLTNDSGGIWRKTPKMRLIEHFEQILKSEPITALVKQKEGKNYKPKEIEPTRIVEKITLKEPEQAADSNHRHKTGTTTRHAISSASTSTIINSNTPSGIAAANTANPDTRGQASSLGKGASTGLPTGPSPRLKKKKPNVEIFPSTFWVKYKKYAGYLVLGVLFGAGLGVLLAMTGYALPIGLAGVGFIAAHAAIIAGMALFVGLVVAAISIAVQEREAVTKIAPTDTKTLQHEPLASKPSWWTSCCFDTSSEELPISSNNQRLFNSGSEGEEQKYQTNNNTIG